MAPGGIAFAGSQFVFAGYSGAPFSNRAFNLRLRAACRALASVHKSLRIRYLWKELGFTRASKHTVWLSRFRQAKADAGLVLLCPLASMAPAIGGSLFGGSLPPEKEGSSTPLERLLNRFRGRAEPRPLSTF